MKLLPVAVLLACGGTRCAGGYDLPAPLSEWVVEARDERGQPDIHDIGYSWNFGEFMAIQQDHYEWSMTRDENGDWRVRDDLLMYYAQGPMDPWEDSELGELRLWVDAEGGLSARPDDGFTMAVWSGQRAVNDVWSDGGVAWAVGDAGLIVRFDGQRADVWDVGLDVDLNAVEGGEVGTYIAGDDGVVLRLDGDVWVEEETGTTLDLFAVDVLAERDMADESTWTERSPVDVGLDAGAVFVAGERGLILRRR